MAASLGALEAAPPKGRSLQCIIMRMALVMLLAIGSCANLVGTSQAWADDYEGALTRVLYFSATDDVTVEALGVGTDTVTMPASSSKVYVWIAGIPKVTATLNKLKVVSANTAIAKVTPVGTNATSKASPTIDGVEYSLFRVTITPQSAGETDITVFGQTQASVQSTAAYTFKLVLTEDAGEKSAAVPTAATGLVYTGSEQSGVEGGEGYTLSGEVKATDAGDYVAKAALDDGYAWSDGTTDDKNVPWSIGKATLTAAYGGEAVEAGGTPDYPVTVTGFVAGEDASAAAGYEAPAIADADKPAVLEPGKSYELTPSGGSAKNYAFEYKAGTLTVGKVSVEQPSFGDFVYTGETREFPTSEYWSLSGNSSAKDAGQYTTQVALKAGCAWSDGYPLSIRTYTWRIEPAELVATYHGEEIDYGVVPALNVSVTGFVHGEDELSAANYIAPSIPTPSNLAAGKSYELTPAGGTASNYTFTYVGGTLTIRAKSEPGIATLALGSGAQATLDALKVGDDETSVDLIYQGRTAADVPPADVTVTATTGGIVDASYDLVTGKLTVAPLAAGTDTLTVTVAGDDDWAAATAQVSVTVSPAASGDGDNDPKPINVDAAYTLTVGGDSKTITYDDEGTLSYTVDKDGIVSVSTSDDGKTLTVSPVAEGVAVVTVTVDGTALDPVDIQFTVQAASGGGSGDDNQGDNSSGKSTVSLDPITLVEGTKMSGSVTIKDGDGNALTADDLAVTSSDVAIATASYANGKLTVNGVAPGTAVITLSSDKLDDDYTVAVTVTKADSSNGSSDTASPTFTFTDLSAQGVAADMGKLVIDGLSDDSEVKLVADALEAGDVYNELKGKVTNDLLGMWNVTLTVDGIEKHDGFGSIALSFPADSAYEGQDATVWHRHNDGSVTSETAKVSGGKVTVTVSDLSDFAVEASKTASTGTSTNAGTSSTVPASGANTAGSGLSKTGDDAMAFVWVSLAVIAIASIAIGLNARKGARRDIEIPTGKGSQG